MNGNMNELPQRKHPRWKSYDYSRNGAYFITICTHGKMKILSDVVGRGLAPAEIRLSRIGEIVQNELYAIENRYDFVNIGPFVIMPNHIHVIFVFNEGAAGASPRPTVMDIVCAFKSLTVKKCRKIGFTGVLFQSSFYDHIIRDNDDYVRCKNYIFENPREWRLDELYTE